MAPIPATWNGTDTQGHPLTWGMPCLTWNGKVPQPTQTKMPHLRVHLGFTKAPDHSVEETGSAVSAGLYGNAAYPSPPVTKAALDAATLAFDKAIAAAKLGGPADTADKNNKREALITLLRQLAGYVQANHHDDLAVLLSSGFDAVSTNRAPAAALAPPHIRDILNGNSGQIILRVDVIRNIRVFQARYAAAGAGGVPGPYQDGGLHNDSRALIINGLTPGTNYTFQVKAVAGGKMESDWSDPVQHMSL